MGESHEQPLAGEVDTVETHMRGRGMRWTSQRRTITEVVFATHEHFSAEELLEMCRKVDPSVSRATVYRTLGMLEDEGFVESLDTGAGGKKFEHVLGHEHHDHMVCTSCGAILEFHDEELERRQELAAKLRGFQIQTHSLKLFGICKDCQATRSDA